MIRRPPISTRTDTLFPYTTLFRSGQIALLFEQRIDAQHEGRCSEAVVAGEEHLRVRTDHLHQLLDIAIELVEIFEADLAHFLVVALRVLRQQVFVEPRPGLMLDLRSEELRVGKELVRTCSDRWSPF